VHLSFSVFWEAERDAQKKSKFTHEALDHAQDQHEGQPIYKK